LPARADGAPDTARVGRMSTLPGVVVVVVVLSLKLAF
jgi:hypothetical protein